MPLASVALRPPSDPIDAARDRSSPGKVTGKLLIAMRALVWEGMTRAEAATKAGLSEHSLYVSLRKPHVLAWYRGELEVLRTSEAARSIHALGEVRDQRSNQMARVAAANSLLRQQDALINGGARGAVPGFVIVVQAPSAPMPHMPHERTIDAKPLIDQACSSHEGEEIP